MNHRHLLALAGLGLSSLLLSGCASNSYSYGLKCAGDCSNGSGTLTYGRSGRTDTGTFQGGLATGVVTIKEADGRSLIVPMVNGLPHGPARARVAGGQEFDQTWAHGLLVAGRSVYANGDTFDGSYRTVLTASGARTLPREGVYATAKGSRYKGRFELVADRLVFRGTPLAASPLPAGSAPFEFAPLTAAALAELQARHVGWSPATVAQHSNDALGAGFYHDNKEYYASLNAGRATTGAPAATAAPAATLAAAPAVSAAAAPAAPGSFQVIEGNTGRFLSPFTSDGVAAGWVDKAINAQMGSALGAAAGAYAGQKALEQVPFVGGFLGSKVGKSAGRNIALNAVGGEAYMRETSDLSFNDIDEMARWLVATHASHTKFNEIMKAAYQIYPELQQAVMRAQYARR